MIDSPESVFYAVPSVTLIADNLPFEELVPTLCERFLCFSCFSVIVAPEVSDGVADQYDLRRLLPVPGDCQVVALFPVVEVALLGAGLENRPVFVVFPKNLLNLRM